MRKLTNLILIIGILILALDLINCMRNLPSV